MRPGWANHPKARSWKNLADDVVAEYEPQVRAEPKSCHACGYRLNADLATDKVGAVHESLS